MKSYNEDCDIGYVLEIDDQNTKDYMKFTILYFLD